MILLKSQNFSPDARKSISTYFFKRKYAHHHSIPRDAGIGGLGGWGWGECPSSIFVRFSPSGITESNFHLEKMTPGTYESKSTKNCGLINATKLRYKEDNRQIITLEAAPPGLAQPKKLDKIMHTV